MQPCDCMTVCNCDVALTLTLDFKNKSKRKLKETQVQYATNFIQLVSPQPVDRFSQTKLHWKAPNKGYLYIYRIYKSDNK